MEFSIAEETRSVQELAAQIFADQSGDAQLRRFDRGEVAYHLELWRLLAEAGLVGVALAEDYGGSGLGFSGLCAVFEEQGRHVAALPLLASSVLAALPLAEFGSPTLRDRWLPRAASGEVVLTGSSLAMKGELPGCREDGKDWILDGRLDFVPYGLDASAVLVPALAADGSCNLFMMACDAAGLGFERQRGTNHEPLDTLTFDSVRVAADAMLGEAGAGEGIREWIAERAATALGFIQLGVLAEALRRTAAHTVERKQFGKQLAAFQAVAHRAADAYIDIEALRSTLLQAAWRIDQGLPPSSAVAVASWWACEAGHRVGHACQHLHGGTGADLDYPIHRYYLWARQNELSLGGGSRILAGFGAELSKQQIEIGL